MTTAECIKKIRKSLCLNSREFAQQIGVDISSVSNYENGKRQPSYPTIRKIIALAKKHHIKITLDDVRPGL